MSEREINGIRRKFIIASTLSFFMVMLAMGGLIYLFTSISARNEVRQVMDVIIENDGELPKPAVPESSGDGVSAETAAAEEAEAREEEEAEDDEFTLEEEMTWSLKDFFGIGEAMKSSEDFLYATRYFAVLFDAEDKLEEIKTSHISRVDENEAEHYARIAKDRMFSFGSFGYFYYEVAKRVGGGTIVIYLDRTTQNAYGMRVFYAALTLIGFGSLIAFGVMRLVSRSIVRGEIENAERQKQFITNASHELKTPLAVIRANTEMQEMLEGETEWTQSTLRQVGRMEGLIANLVMIARAREKDKGNLSRLDISVPVRETAESFAAVAASEGKSLEIHVADGIQMLAEEGAVRQLVSLLIDNAVKYCDAGGRVSAILEKQGKKIRLAVINSFKDGNSVDTARFFDRFYRQDDSHNTDKGGYGIGLSVAESLVKQMGGSIGAHWKDGDIIFECNFFGK